MIIAALNESPGESRVAITPNTVKQYSKAGFTVICESRAGEGSGFSDEEYIQAGASIEANRKELLKKASILVCINEPLPTDLRELVPQTLIISPMDNNSDSIPRAAEQQISLFSMNLIPRISRAQSMDSLSSQANLAGYRAVLEGVQHFKRAIPMMMTAAGMIQPAKILVLGAGVAGLQATATAKRLGAVIYAFDVRRAAKEQVESLGAEFIEVDSSTDKETNSVYASEMSEEYKALQARLIDKYAKMADIIICTALIPGRKAPLLITAETLDHMKPGSVIVDLATARGGNCALSQADRVIRHKDITIVGYSNMAGFIPATASELYANNVLNVVRLLAPSGTSLQFNPEDEIIRQALLCHEGKQLPFIKEQQNA